MFAYELVGISQQFGDGLGEAAVFCIGFVIALMIVILIILCAILVRSFVAFDKPNAPTTWKVDGRDDLDSLQRYPRRFF